MTLMAPIIPVAAAVKGAEARTTALRPVAKANLTPEDKMESYLFKPTAAAAPVGPVITATKKDTFNDPNNDGKAELNDTITYDVNINNGVGGPDATGVNFTDTIDPNTTFVPGSLKVSPLAFADTYFATKNTPLDTAASSLPGVLANDTGIPAPSLAGIVGCVDVTAPYVCTTTHGSVTLNSDGSFTYTPTAGYEGPDSFVYTVTNGLTPDDTASVTINVDAPPSVTTTTPVNGATNQTTTPTITINFSESVSATNTAFKIECPTGTPQTFTQSASPASSFTLTPTTPLPAGTTCTVTVVANQISDTDTNDPPDNMAADFNFSFTTDAAPSVTSTTPVNGAPSVATNTPITVTFSESVAATTSSFTIECPTGTPKTYTLSASPATTFTLTPTTPLPAGTTCTVTVIANQIHDTDAFDPPDTMAANFVFSFTTDAAPSVLTTSPVNGATGVTTDATITVNFSESVQATTSSFTLECPVGTPKAYTLSASPASSFTLTPTGGLPGGVTCTVTVIAAQIHDNDSVDPPDTMVANFVFSFTTDAAPTVISIVPTNGATGIGGNDPITITFSESVQATTSSFTLECPTGTPVPFNLSASPASSFTLTPTATMPAGTVCTVTVIANQIHDTDAFDPPDTMAANFVSSFTIDVAPTVQSTSPVNNAIDVAETSNITVTFSEPVTATTSSFTLECPAGTAKTFSVSGSGTSTITLDPTVDLPPGVICTVTVIANQISDTDTGDPPDHLVSNFAFSFGVKPRAVDDVRTATGNVRIDSNISGFSVLTNDLPAGITISAFDATSAHGGNVTMNTSTGRFTYNPPPGYTGADTFNYTISNAAGSDVGTVTINISDMIWFIKNDATSCTTVSAAAGCGRLTNPLSTLAAFEAANGTADVPLSNIYNPQAGDNIFIYTGAGNYTAPLTLENTQRVIGQGATSSILSLTGISLAPDSDALPATGGTAPTITSGGIGIDLKSNDSLYGLKLSNTTGTAINTTVNIGTFVLGDVVVDNSGSNGAGIILDDGGTSVTTTGLNTIKARSATALNITNVPIGSGNVTFRSIDAGNNDANPDAANGIILNNTGTAAGNGGLIVTGNSNGNCGGVVNVSAPATADCTGGTIQNHTGTGISLTSTKNVSLTRMYVFNNADTGIKATTVNGISVISSDIDSNDNSGGNSQFESGMYLSEVYGTAAITNSWISESFNTDLRIENSNVTNGALTVNMSGTTVMNSGASNSLANVFNFLGTLTSNMTLNMTNSRIKGNQGAGALTTDGLRADTSGGNMTLNIGTSTFQNNFVALDVTLGGTANSKHLTLDIHDNPTITGSAGSAINVTAGGGFAGDTINAKIRNNVIGTNGVVNSGSLNGFGMDIDNESTAAYTVSITGNTIREIQTFDGIFARQVVSAGSMSATITGNTIDQIHNSGASNIFAINTAITSAGSICANISGNTLTNIDPNNFGNGKKIRARQTSGTFNLTQASANALATANGLPAGQAETLGAINFNQPPCATPPLMVGKGGVEAEMATAITDDNIVSDAKLSAIVEAAIQRWTAAGLTAEQIASMRRVKFEVATLSDSYLAEADDNLIRVDKSAGDNGWFIDTTPQDDAEFTYVVSGTHRYTTSDAAPAGRIDLLTAIIHELGHEIGLPDSYLMLNQSSVMYGYLVKGERRLPFEGQAVGAHHSALDGTHYLTGPTTSRKAAKSAKAQAATSAQTEQAASQTFNNRAGIKAKLQLATKSLPVVSTLMPSGEVVSTTIGTLRANKTVHIQFQVTVTSIPASSQVSNQGKVSGNFSDVFTDDPDTGASNDATITPVLGVPVAMDDAYSTFKNTPLNIAAPGVLVNDTNSPTVSAVGGCADVTAPFSGCNTVQNGTVTLNADGSFSYTPPSGYTGTDSFTYTATNAAGSDTATVNITVTDTSTIYINEVLFNPPGTDAPNEYIELRGTPNATIPAGTYLVAIEGDGADNPGDVQTYINLSGLSFGSNGFLVLLQQGNTYTTAAGTTVVTSTTTGFGGLPGGIFVADGGATDIEDASVTFMLVQTGVAPTLTDDIDSNDDGTPDGSIYGGWNVRDSVGVLDGTSAADRAYGAINFSNNTGTNGTATGTVVLVGFTAGYVGRIGDSTGSAAADWAASGTLGGAAPNWTLGTAAQTEPSSFAGKPLNHIGASNFTNLAPVNTVPAGVQTTDEDVPLVFTGATQISISDPDAGSAPVQVTLTATNGIITLSGTTGLTFNSGANGTAAMNFNGTITDINNALNNLTFTPAPANYNGSASLTILTDDLGNTGVGGNKTDSDTVNITVNPVNDPPSFTLSGNPPTVTEDAGPQTVNSFATNISQGPGDPAQTLTFNVSPVGTTGNINFSSGPAIDSTTGNLTYTTSSDTNGTATFSVTLSDNGSNVPPNSNTSGAQQFTITVTAVNDAPSFQIPSNPPAVNEDAGAQTVNSFATNFQPGPATATDETGQTLVGYTVTQTGTTGNLTFTSGPSINNAGQLTYTPSANVSGTATFDVVATDSGSGTSPNVNQSAPVSFTITVTGQNDAPVLDNSGNMSLNAINEDVANASNNGTLVSDIIASAGGDRITDVDAGAVEGLAVTAVNNTNGTWQFSIDNGTNWTPFGSPDQTTARLLASNATTRVRFVPAANFNGTVDPGLTFRAWDQTSGTNGGTADTSTNGGTSAFSIMTETASITVNPVNDQPTANAQTVGTAEDTPVGITLTGSDIETASGSLVYTVTVPPANGVLSGTGANRTYTPNPNYNGPDSFKFTVTDTGDGASPPLTSAEATVTINVGAVNDAPTADSQSVSTNEDTAKAITLTGNDIDTPAGSLTYIIVAGPSHGTVSPGTGPNRTYTPTGNYNGPDSFTFKINDGTADSNVATVSITVNPVNDTPTADPQSVSTNEDTPKAITLSGSDTETPSASLTFNVTVQPTHGVLTGTGANRTYTPNADYNGPDSFKFTVTDTGDGTSAPLTSSEATVSITVSAVNDAPVNSIPSPQGATKNGQLVFSAANSNLISISDVDAGSNSLKVTLTATHGTITLSGTSGLAFTVGDGTQDATMTFTGNLTNINAALNGLIFEPTNGYDGPATIQLTSDDQGNTGSGGAQTDTDTINITVNKGGVLSFSSATYTVAESGGSIIITVNRLGGSFGTTKVDYATSNGTAIAPQDYTATSGQLTFGNGETTKTFVVPIVNDALNEAPETVNLTLSNVSGSGELGSPATAVLTITDDDPQPSLSINDATVTEGNSGTVNANFTVTLSAQSGQTVTVNYATANGTATAGSDYQAQSNTLTFAPGETSKVISVVVNGDTASEPDENFFVNLSGASNAGVSDNQGLGTIISDDSPVIQFSASTYNVAEDGLRATVTVNRLGDISKPAAVDYATSDSAGLTNCSVVNGIASSRCDYAVSVGTLRFAANEASKTISIPIVNDVYVEGPESFTITLSHQTGGEPGSPTIATITINDNDNGGAPNPMDDNAFFIRQLYIDFLGREPDPPGLRGWLSILNNCPVDDTSCDRIHIAEGFARSDEFAGRGYFIYRIYRASLGRKPDYAEFIPDMAKVSGFLNPQDLEANKQAFVDEFVTRTEFRSKYDSLDNSGYVNALEATALVTLPNKQALIDDLVAGRKTRAQVLRAVIETIEVYTKYVNEAFVVMEYFGFLRRDPDALYKGWIDQFNHSNIHRLIIGGFVFSAEYRQRFGPQ
jgi:methionine-rich copper-binding protein CopC